jgi:hypothetical protein
MAVTIQAPFHVQRVLAAHERHVVDRAVALFASDATRHMNAVIEIDKVGQIVDASPANWLPGSGALVQSRQFWAVPPDQPMTRETCFRGWQPCEGRDLDSGVAIPAIDSQLTRVVAVTKFDRLVTDHIDFRRIIRSVDYK